MNARDFARRKEFSERFLSMTQRDKKCTRRVLFIDEATFTQDEMFSFHDYHEWRQTNQRLIREASRQLLKLFISLTC